MQTTDDEDNDFSLVIQNPASQADAWHWEIFRMGRKSPIQRSSGSFKTQATATTAGNAAFRRLMTDLNS